MPIRCYRESGCPCFSLLRGLQRFITNASATSGVARKTAARSGCPCFSASFPSAIRCNGEGDSGCRSHCGENRPELRDFFFLGRKRAGKTGTGRSPRAAPRFRAFPTTPGLRPEALRDQSNGGRPTARRFRGWVFRPWLPDKPKALEVLLGPAGLRPDHRFQGFSGEGIPASVRRYSHAPAVRVAVTSMSSTLADEHPAYARR